MHICIAALPLVSSGPYSYFGLVRFYSSSQKPNPKRDTPPPNRAL
jgi:hypothetical protein